MASPHNPSRRAMIGWIAGVAIAPLPFGAGAARAKSYRITYSETEWRRRLSPTQFRILRQAGTERPYSSPLEKEERQGTFLCAGCANALFDGRTKYESGTGWPSFWKPLPGAVGTSTDFKLGYPRTEVHCADCGGHLSHVFNDGPRPTGKRYCMNGAAMTFRPSP